MVLYIVRRGRDRGGALQDAFDAFLETYTGGLTKSLLEAELEACATGREDEETSPPSTPALTLSPPSCTRADGGRDGEPSAGQQVRNHH